MKLTPEQKEALKAKLEEEGLDERRKPTKITLSDDKKKEMEKILERAKQEKLEKLDKTLRAHEKKGKE